MQKWEYLIVTLSETAEGWKPRYTKGQELDDWENGPTSHEFMDKLGGVGWECFDVEITRDSADHILSYWMYFKRPKS